MMEWLQLTGPFTSAFAEYLVALNTWVGGIVSLSTFTIEKKRRQEWSWRGSVMKVELMNEKTCQRSQEMRVDMVGLKV
jgi:hypothetical protein